MSSEMPIGLSRLRGEAAPVAEESTLGGWEFPLRKAVEPKNTPQPSLGASRPLLRPDAPTASMPAAAKPEMKPFASRPAQPTPAASHVSPQASPQTSVPTALDKGEVMALMLELSQVLLQEGNPQERRQRWLDIRRQLDDLLR